MAPHDKQSHEVSIEDDVKLLSTTLDELLKYSGDYADSAFQDLKKQAYDSLQDVRSRLEPSKGCCHRAKKFAKKADSYIQDNPWHGLGIGASVGLVLGILLARK
ncbi:protein ElaB [Lonsdalea britannica]|uniref:DUF883 domain-containing protein n=1 Tax=Lonsdalea britannica TaxID=1082704 RepID=A0AAD0SIQ7_9GAMM|nr:DUF883 family protein [Lonsdalea britannica]AXW88453.1 DUF883 domain-containing protein [Lonsdalea britannica]OSN00602.1 protein ElaB [Lonsdalea britannica]OSN09379.1 protein ElaB [Lonsdalea britannica]